MYKQLCLLLLAGIIPCFSQTAPPAPFLQCPAVGADTSCAVLIVANPDGTFSTFSDSTQGPFDTIEDTLVGIQNNSNRTIFSIPITSSSPIFAFDGDGICGISSITGQPYSPGPSGCPFGPTTYEGPGVSFTVNSDSSGRVNFPNGLKPNQSTFFSLEEADFTMNICGGAGQTSAQAQITAAGVSCGPQGVKTVTWGHFGPRDVLQADSGETLQVACNQVSCPAGTAPGITCLAFQLLYTPPGGQTMVVGKCPFEGGCNSGWFYHVSSQAGSSTTNPGCFVETDWWSRDYGSNDIPNHWNGATSENPPVLDFAKSSFGAATGNLQTTDAMFLYNSPFDVGGAPGTPPSAVGSPYVPASFCSSPVQTVAGGSTIGPPEGKFVGEQPVPNSAVDDPPVGGLPMQISSVSPGDLNGDGKVDVNDFNIFNAAFGSCMGQSGYNSKADLDDDGCVTLKDYQRWFQFFANP